MPMIVQDGIILFPKLQSQTKEIKDDDDQPSSTIESTQTLSLLQFTTESSHPLFSTKVLTDLFLNGKSEFIMLVFIKIHEILQKPQEQLFSAIVFDSLTEMLRNIEGYVDSQVVQMAQEETTKK